jgi:Flp pilus assembly protein TadG
MRALKKVIGQERRGAIIPLFALLLPVLILLAAFAINVAYLELNRTEMYVAADSASRAACREMAITNDKSSALVKGKEAGTRNPVGGKSLVFSDSDFSFGQSSRPSLNSRYQFSPNPSQFNSVEVTANKTASSPNGAIDLPIPNLFSNSTVESQQTSRSSQIEVDIALVIDRSGSMAYSDSEKTNPPIADPTLFPNNAPATWKFGDPVPSPSRWLDAVAAVDVFLAELNKTPSNEMVSMTTYNNGTATDHGLTNNYTSLRNSLNKYTNNFAIGGTNIGGGILDGRQEILGPSGRQFAAKVMIVLTDGIDTEGSNPVSAAETCFDNKIMIFTITFSNEADKTTMASVAKKALGKHYHASTGAGLQNVFKDIARQLPILISR